MNEILKEWPVDTKTLQREVYEKIKIFEQLSGQEIDEIALLENKAQKKSDMTLRLII